MRIITIFDHDKSIKDIAASSLSHLRDHNTIFDGGIYNLGPLPKANIRY